ncbi:MAG: redoxin domain-containing protein [Candidatus Thalassarchaeaceae archaeon]|jgi:peroxiredoxin|nr:redoxin domain-containing protein [Candidatus Thalassarchaeaceae archaeon]|tara:strand:+ start:410 stop:964 length:555 start_codon:yes stop_codon:yes gene_type:complete
MSQLKTMIIVLLTLTSTLVGCIGSDDDSAPSTAEKIPPLTAPNQHGDNVTLSDMEGTMLVILINMGEWCSYCIQATENATSLIQEMEDIDNRYNISFVEILGSNETSEAANQTYAMNWSVQYNTTHSILHSQVANDYAKDNIDVGFPTYWIVDPEGLLRVISSGVNSITAEDVQEQYDLFLLEK